MMRARVARPFAVGACDMARSLHPWTGVLDRRTGLTYWTDLLD
jgi:hypothetical protein